MNWIQFHCFNNEQRRMGRAGNGGGGGKQGQSENQGQISWGFFSLEMFVSRWLVASSEWLVDSGYRIVDSGQWIVDSG
jgi:hypothetical protein